MMTPNKLTFIEIANPHGKENLYSDILAFFLNPIKPHNLGITVLKALIETAYPECIFEEDPGSVYISREFPIKGNATERKGRLDFFIRTKKYVIGIENKIDHKLDNPLHWYDEELKAHVGKDNKKIKRIVLSVKPNLPKDDKWKRVTYEKFFEKLKMNDLESSPYSEELNQFISSITNISQKKQIQEPLSAHASLKKQLSKEWEEWHDSNSDGCSFYFPFKSLNIQVFAYIDGNTGGWYVGIQLNGKIERGGASLKLFDFLDEKSDKLNNYEYVGNGRAGKQCKEPYLTDRLNEMEKELLRLKEMVETFLEQSQKEEKETL